MAHLYGGLDVREARERFHPFENLSAHYLLLAPTRPVIRPATPPICPLVRGLWQAFDAEIPDAPWRDDDSNLDLASRAGDRQGHRAARGGGRRAGRPRGRCEERGTARLRLHPLRAPRGAAARRRGDLVRETASLLRGQGAEMLELEVLASNDGARAVYESWGFAPAS